MPQKLVRSSRTPLFDQHGVLKGYLDDRYFTDVRDPVVSLNFRDEVLSAAYHQIRASQGTKVPLTV